MAEENREEAVIKINDKEYQVSSLSKEAMANVQALRFAQNEVNRLRARAAMAQTAVNAYRQALMKNLPQDE